MNDDPHTVQPPKQEVHVMPFTIGEEAFAVPLDRIREVLRSPRITRVPKAPAHIVGVVNLHGEVAPVIDLARRFNIGETPRNSESWVVFFDTDAEPVGILAESVSKPTRVLEENIERSPPAVKGIAACYLDGVARHAGSLFVLLNATASVSPREPSADGGVDASTDATA